MKFLADESVDQPIVERLRQEAHVILAVAEMAPRLPDAEVLSLANEQAAILMTGDKDFGELVFRHGRHAHGVVLIRLAGLSAAGKGELVVEAVRDHADELPGAFTVISPGAVRIRRWPV